MKYILITIFLTVYSNTILGQMKRFRITPRKYGFQFKPEVKFVGGQSYTLGLYAQLSPTSNTKGNANNGYFCEFRVLQRSPLRPLWSIQLSLGYMKHPIAMVATAREFGLASFEGKAWNHYYMMPGLGFRGGKKWKFELSSAAGIFVYHGSNLSSGILHRNRILEVQSWKYSWAMGGGIKTGVSLGFKLNKYWTIFMDGSYCLGRGRRAGTRTTQQYNTDPVKFTAIGPPFYAINQTVFDTVILNTFNLGIGIKYQVYKYLYDPNRRYWNYY